MEVNLFPNLYKLISRLSSCRPATAQVERVHSLLTLTTGKNRTCLKATRLFKLVFLKLRWSDGQNAMKWTSLSKLEDVVKEGATLFELYEADNPDNNRPSVPEVVEELQFE